MGELAQEVERPLSMRGTGIDARILHSFIFADHYLNFKDWRVGIFSKRIFCNSYQVATEGIIS